jgi:hypothetical protein
VDHQEDILLTIKTKHLMWKTFNLINVVLHSMIIGWKMQGYESSVSIWWNVFFVVVCFGLQYVDDVELKIKIK